MPEPVPLSHSNKPLPCPGSFRAQILYLAPNGPPLGRYPGGVEAAGPVPIGPLLSSARPLTALIGRRRGARGIGGGGVPPSRRPSRGRRGSGLSLRPAPRARSLAPGSSRLLSAISRLPPAPAQAPAQRRRRVGAAAGGAPSEGWPPHCPRDCPSLAPQPPGTPPGPPEAGKGGGRRLRDAGAAGRGACRRDIPSLRGVIRRLAGRGGLRGSAAGVWSGGAERHALGEGWG